MTYRWKCWRRSGAAGANVPFRPHLSYWCRTLYCPKQAQMIMLLQCLPHFSCHSFYFASTENVCHINDIKRDEGDGKPWSCVLKLSSFFGRHMIRIAGMHNPDAGAGRAKICSTGCRAAHVMTAVSGKPVKGARLSKGRLEQSCRRAFCAFN